MSEIKKYPLYDIGWIANVLQPISSQIKIVCLDRSFPNLVASHRDWDQGLEMHTRVMAVYKQFLSQLLVNDFPSKDWVVLPYEALSGDLAQMKMITGKLGHFFGELLAPPCPPPPPPPPLSAGIISLAQLIYTVFICWPPGTQVGPRTGHE